MQTLVMNYIIKSKRLGKSNVPVLNILVIYFTPYIKAENVSQCRKVYFWPSSAARVGSALVGLSANYPLNEKARCLIAPDETWGLNWAQKVDL